MKSSKDQKLEKAQLKPHNSNQILQWKLNSQKDTWKIFMET